MQYDPKAAAKFQEYKDRENARWVLACAIEDITDILSDLIPILDAHTHSVALTLDEALNSVREALTEMSDIDRLNYDAAGD